MKVTVGIAFLNDRETLTDAIRSVFAQTFDDWELILLDDGSNDGSLDIARGICDPRVRVVCDGTNRGLAYRLNEIASRARGQYVARMDADDLMHPERLTQQVRFLDEHPTVGLVGTGMCAIDRAHYPVGQRDGQPAPPAAFQLLRGRGLAHATLLFRASWARENPYDVRFRRAQDLELWCRVMVNGRLTAGRICRPLYYVREEDAARVQKVLETYRVCQKICWRHGPKLVGWRRTSALIAAYEAKRCIYRLFGLLGQHRLLLRRRNSPLSDQQQAEARQALELILSTPVPGLPQRDSVCRHRAVA